MAYHPIKSNSLLIYFILPLYERKVEEEKSTREGPLNEVVISGDSGRASRPRGKAWKGHFELRMESCDYFNLKNPKAPINSDIVRERNT